uniref:Dolichyl-diphosphooligosaccharide--protein glycosyltransferase subunit 1 n=1 Tax=Ciona savignyi TaxID=51511 RepID=H2Z4F9_CIOSA
MRFVDHIMDDQVVEDLTIKIILPEGAKNIKTELPYPAKREDDSLHFTYLDTVGRPVITFTKKNLVEQHIDDFVVSYTFNRLLLLQEPLLIVGAFFILFFTVIIIVRLDFSIAHDKVQEARMRVQGVIEQVQSHQAKRQGCYEAYQAAVTKYKSTKDHSSLVATRKSIESSHKEATNTINQLLVKLREDAVEAADKGGIFLIPKKKFLTEVIQAEQLKASRLKKKAPKRSCALLSIQDSFQIQTVSDYIKTRMSVVQQLNQIDATLKDKISHSIQLAEKLVQGKINREQYMDQDGKNQKVIEENVTKIEKLANSL